MVYVYFLENWHKGRSKGGDDVDNGIGKSGGVPDGGVSDRGGGSGLMGSGGDGICGSGDEYDVSGYGGGDGNGNVAATAAISASVSAAHRRLWSDGHPCPGYQSGWWDGVGRAWCSPQPHPHPRSTPVISIRLHRNLSSPHSSSLYSELISWISQGILIILLLGSSLGSDPALEHTVYRQVKVGCQDGHVQIGDGGCSSVRPYRRPQLQESLRLMAPRSRWISM
ncbi:hypothetical protein Tco_1047903 [Tanacetum coccineum]